MSCFIILWGRKPKITVMARSFTSEGLERGICSMPFTSYCGVLLTLSDSNFLLCIKTLKIRTTCMTSIYSGDLLTLHIK